jgi:hypothetical protein
LDRDELPLEAYWSDAERAAYGSGPTLHLREDV